MHVCTIIAKNYVAYARVLARSLEREHPGTRLSVLIIDDYSRFIDPAKEPFEILTPEQVGCEPFVHMALRYSVLELSTAVKPWLLRHLLAVTGGPVTYLDPDIRLYGSVAPLTEQARQHGVAVTPHNSAPIPADGHRPSQVDVMIAGVYNLGFVALAACPEVDRLLDWWSERLRRDCRVDPIWGYFVDQRWFDLVPGFLEDLAIVRDPAYNLAYWNLHERSLEGEPGHYRVDGRPLSFVHFSGFDPAHPLVLSRHQDRIDVTADPVLEGLLDNYAGEVLAEGHAESRGWPYDFGAFGDGTRLDANLRGLFDEYATEHGDRVQSPFTLAGVRAFDRWLAEPVPGGPEGISRALAKVYESRTDLRRAFPELRGEDLVAFREWAAGAGAQQEALLRRPAPDVVTTTPAAEPSPQSFAAKRRLPGAPLTGALWGVNLVGEYRSERDAGVIVRAMVDALDAGGIGAAPVATPEAVPGETGWAFDAVSPERAPFAINVICGAPARLPQFAAQAGESFFADRYTVALWLAEGEPVGAVPDILSLLEAVWAPSEHVRHALQSVTSSPVDLVRLSVSPGLPGVRSRAELELPEDRFVFHSRFSYREGFARKNPIGLVAAFSAAFRPGEGAHLRIDCADAATDHESHAGLLEAAAAHEDIEVVDRGLSLTEVRSVTAASDCYVSLHRGEVFGLAMAEAMWFGKPVIATDHSGNLDYMTGDNSRPVDYRLVPIPAGQEYLPGIATWAEPDVAHAASLMRSLFEHPAEVGSLGATAADSVRTTHSPAASAVTLRRSIEAIRATGQGRRTLTPELPLARSLGRLPTRLSEGPPPITGRRGNVVRRSLRDALLRVIKPYTAYQQSVNAELLMALTELSSEIVNKTGAERAERDAERADLLAAARGNDRIGAALGAGTAGVEYVRRILTEQTDRTLFVALAELVSRHTEIRADAAPPAESRPLAASELRVFSQNGEDGVLAELLRRVGAPTRYFIELGVDSGREGNCVYLADVAGWEGLFIEADDEMFAQLERKYVAQSATQTVKARVTTANVERLFAQVQVPPEPDVLSIDVDGQDYWLWAAIESYRPRVVIVEYNSALDPRRQLVQPDEPGHVWDGSDFYGASLGALSALGAQKGYQLVHTDLSGVNAFFVRSDLGAGSLPAPDDVIVRVWPNYYQRGTQHPRAHPPGRYLDLESGKLVASSRPAEPGGET